MKILMVSMFSNHFFNWTKQLEDEGHNVYWLDVYDANTYVKKIDFVHQIIGWRNKIKYPGRYKIKKDFPLLYDFINRFNHEKLNAVFEAKLKKIQPDVVQTFEMFSSSIPILEVMEKYPEIPWVYSVWGNDLFYFQKEKMEKQQIQKVLGRVNYLFADCKRDFSLAEKLGFKNSFLGVYPTGGGYDLSLYDPYIKILGERKIILIKGYQHTFGRCNVVLKALVNIRSSLKDHEVVVFGANKEVINFAERENLVEWNNFRIYGQISNERVLELMGKAAVYIGNSVSDGMPNTLLEAIIMGAFPIQSNPGGVTEEIIIHGRNGFLIKDPEDAIEISMYIKKALTHPEIIERSVKYNFEIVKPTLERTEVKEKVIKQYRLLEENLREN